MPGDPFVLVERIETVKFIVDHNRVVWDVLLVRLSDCLTSIVSRVSE